ncbi:tetratricopeptide repeat protein [Halomonas sp. DN3]|uniref:tetratricopeptide repeat protein n=1 Tax=Halomonas sp. DN3 TaxID=2953657 RepID=UPI00209D3B85|nr:hypothetical protein [Halomonas sp. DN3]USZ48755.1 hypothetical protein NKF27_14755 [Halomonas sp. DN3]
MMPATPPAAIRLSRALCIAACAGLTGCAINDMPPGPQALAPLPVEAAGWFDQEPARNAEWMHKPEVEAARTAMASGHIDEAYRRLAALAAQGLPRGYYELGKLNEKRFPEDPEPAMAAYRHALEHPSHIHPQAAFRLARLLLDSANNARQPLLAYYLLEHAVAEGVGERAQVALATLLIHGDEKIAADSTRALALFQAAADAGSDDAMLALARAYAPDGWLPASATRSRQWAERYAGQLRQQATDGNVSAMVALARYCDNGELAPRRPATADYWYQEAAKAGATYALTQAGKAALERGEKVRAKTLLSQAAESGDVPAMLILGKLALEHADPQGAERWWQQAIGLGSVEATYLLGRELSTDRQAGDSEALDTDPMRGYRLLEQAARSGHLKALVALAQRDLAASPPRIRLALDRLRQAWSGGEPSAALRLGQWMVEHPRTEADLEEGKALLQAALAGGEITAARVLAEAQLPGGTLPPQPGEAERLLHQAIDAGDVASSRILAIALADGVLGAPRRNEGIHRLLGLAEQGDVSAMMHLGRAYRDGQGVAANLEIAHRWFVRARSAGHPGAARALAGLTRQRAAQGDIDALRLAAGQGHPSAMASLGTALMDGKGVARNIEAGADWLTRAADAGHAGAAAELGRRYRDGLGVPVDPDLARHYLDLAAIQHQPSAQRDLARLLIDQGEFEVGAAQLVPLAQAGDVDSALALGELYLDHPDLPQAPAKARHWLEWASQAGEPAAQVLLGTALLRGEHGQPQDSDTAEAMLLEAANAGHAGAQATLGRAYLEGDWLEPAPRKGIALLLAAARQGHPTAKVTLARTYLRSMGLPDVSQQSALLWLDGLMRQQPSHGLEALEDLLLGGPSAATAPSHPAPVEPPPPAATKA